MMASCADIAPLISDALRQGGRTRLTVTGSSMRPFIRSGQVVELSFARADNLVPGTVVLSEAGDGRYLLHRITRTTPDGVFTRGDANFHEEGPFTCEHIVARVAGVVYGDRVRPLDAGFYGALARLWYATRLGLWLIAVHDFCRRATGLTLRRLGFLR